ncbi:hypothetical protein EAH88_19370 [Rhodanobacter glycinis]|uniref:Uncharacterized protein n=1 Tax=Rhodanobacter glycinis TaxID=582702 RepID=A0A502BTP3_9GAMM|nr:hypothetical protein EAH88_19370 [Rhodanobacter glycinis]
MLQQELITIRSSISYFGSESILKVGLFARLACTDKLVELMVYDQIVALNNLEIRLFVVLQPGLIVFTLDHDSRLRPRRLYLELARTEIWNLLD